MAAKAGTPKRVVQAFEGGPEGGADYEVHEPAEGAELVVCGACGFTYGAEHTVTGPEGREGYECPICLTQALLRARQEVIERTVAEGSRSMLRTVRVTVTRLQKVAALAVFAVRGEKTLFHVEQALREAGYDPDTASEFQPIRTPGKVAAALAFARETWRRDGAEGETVHLLCDELEALLGIPKTEKA